MDDFFTEMFPIPTVAELRGRVSSEWFQTYGSALVRFILDATELRMQQPCSRKAARTCCSCDQPESGTTA
eukprot:scaffold540089_cov15-Prasinocladus_malaysianus.AAC.1